MKVEPQHYAGVNFDWMVVRELTFVDDANRYEIGAALPPIEAGIKISSHLDQTKRVCRTVVVLTLEPGDGEGGQFRSVRAIVEGQFSVIDQTVPSVSFEQFAERQAAAILMPFAREAIARVTSQSRFGQVLMPPINVIAVIEAMKQSGPAQFVAEGLGPEQHE